MIWIVFQHSSLSAQLFWTTYEVPEKLQFESLFQDSKGYIWLGNHGSVYRFDGINWDSYILEDSSRSSIRCFTERGNGELWLGLENGDIFFQKDTKWQRFDPEEGTPKKPINSLIFDSDDRLWISTYGEGLYYFSQGRMYNADIDDGLPSNDIYAAILGPNSEIWCATDRGLGIFWLENGVKKFKTLGKKEGLSDEICTGLFLAKNGDVLVGMYDGSLASISKVNGMIMQHQNCSENPIKQILDDGSNLWVLDQEGVLWKQNDQSLIRIKTPGLAKHIYLCKGGRLWILDEKNNIYSASTYINKVATPPVIPQAIAYGPSGDLWVGSADGLFSYQRSTQTWNSIPLDKELNISALYLDHLRRIWIGTLGQGLWIFNPVSKKCSPQSLIGNTSKVPILSISGNQTAIWVATFGGAYLCNLSAKGQIISQRHFQEADGLGINYIYQTLTDTAGNTLLATDGHGIGIWENNELHLDKSLSGSSIFSISKDTEEGLWILGDNGEVIYKSKTGTDTLLPSNVQQPLAIHAISARRAILVYGKELYCFDREIEQLIPLLTEKQFQGFGTQLNLVAEGKSGELFLGSPEGILRLDVKKIPANLGPETSVKTLRINLQVAEKLKYIFEHDQNHLSIEYSGLWYQEPDRLMFKHRLKGRDLNWIESRDQQAVYADLSPGEYTFELMTGVNGFYNSDNNLTYNFQIKKPFWLNPFFLMVLFIAIAMIIALIIRYRESHIKNAQKLIQQNIEHQFETLRTQINPHFLFNAFSTLSDIVDENPQKAVAYIDRLSDMFRDTLRYRDRSLILLEEELEVLDNYYALQKERYGSNFRLETSINQLALDKKVPPLVLQILVENTLRHNIASKEDPLDVRVFSEENNIIVQNRLQLRSSASKSTRMGIQNIKARYQLLTDREIEILECREYFTVKIPLLN